MNSVPNMMPSVPASVVQSAVRPTLGPTKPMVMVKKVKLPRNQNGPWLDSLSVRSFSGMKSIECPSTTDFSSRLDTLGADLALVFMMDSYCWKIMTR
ncbi:hypothetical protein D3C76_822160 [compost metagenome]